MMNKKRVAYLALGVFTTGVSLLLSLLAYDDWFFKNFDTIYYSPNYKFLAFDMPILLAICGLTLTLVGLHIIVGNSYFDSKTK